MVRRLPALGLALAAVMVCGPAAASGPGTVSPWYVDQFGGEAGDLAKLYAGRQGVVMARAPRPMLYLNWRLLHGQQVGEVAGRALSIPCCDPPGRWNYETQPERGVQAWLTARKIVPDIPVIDWIETEREGPDYTSIPNCFDEAFDVAAATLKDRAARFGAASASVKAWLVGQDAVFATCHEAGKALPTLAADAPAWLAADRAYQVAAQALYDQRFEEAATAFAAIARDGASPWRGSAPYLRVRALTRTAFVAKTPEAFARARAAVADLQKAPSGTFGRDQARGMLRALAYRDRPGYLMAELDRELSRREAGADIAVSFRDYSGLYDQGISSPEAMDWIATLRARPDKTEEAAAYGASDSDAAVAALTRKTREAALTHAQERWTKSRDPAWLIAALSLTNPGMPQAGALASDAQRVQADHPAWLTAQFHAIRLDLAILPASESRARLDTVLRRPDLSVSDRNIFTALRAQVAADPGEFAQLALRRRLCADDSTDGCVRSFWYSDTYQEGGVYDGVGREGARGFGEDARAVIDRLPLASRIALSRDPRIPAPLRLDVALTSYARAIVLGEVSAADQLAQDLETLLPQMAGDFRRARTTPTGAGKRFAQLFIFAKIPGLRLDLADYVRPEGTVAEFQQYWIPWMTLPRNRPMRPSVPPPLAAYQTAGVTPPDDASSDLACLGECGYGAAPLRLPDFAAVGATQAMAERGFFIARMVDLGGDAPPPAPAVAISMWDELLTFARANPAHPQVPEALYWLVRVGRFGGSYDHSGRRAFQLLHAKYPTTSWARRSPYYYD